MTANKRIFLNIVATYGRSLFSLVCGLFTMRWVLMALGSEAYGLFGVIGTVIILCTTLNYTISASVARFYAFALGRAAIIGSEKAMSECKGWFNVAVLINFVIPIALFTVGLFLGDWAIDHYFSIPSSYVLDAHFILRCSLVTMFVGMVSSPFRSMYSARQLIAEMTVYDLLNPLLLIVCSYWLLTYSGDRLRAYALFSMLIASAPSLIINVRAMIVFKECRIDLGMMFDKMKFKRFFSFAGWQFVGLTGLTIRNQGAPLVVNKYVGIAYNSTMSIANNIVNQTGMLSSALNNAFAPAITSAVGACDNTMFYMLSLQASKFGTVLVGLFVIPLALEADYVIKLWLEEPPPDILPLCIIMLANALVERCSYGALIAINAAGNVKWHELLCFVIHCITIFISYSLAALSGLGVVGVGLGLFVGTVLLTCMRMTLWKIQLSFPIDQWMNEFVLPFAFVLIISVGIGLLSITLFDAGFFRLVMTSGVVIGVFMASTYLFVLNQTEKTIVLNQVMSRLHVSQRRLS